MTSQISTTELQRCTFTSVLQIEAHFRFQITIYKFLFLGGQKVLELLESASDIDPDSTNDDKYLVRLRREILEDRERVEELAVGAAREIYLFKQRESRSLGKRAAGRNIW
jgi:hypothetical protein